MDLKDRTKWAIDFVAQKENLTNGRIARMIGSGPHTVRKYREKISAPKINFISRFCRTFGIDFQWLALGEGQPCQGIVNLPEEIDFLSNTEDGAPGMEDHWLDHSKKSCPERLSQGQSGKNAEADSDQQEMDMDVEMSLQKLALLQGIKIDINWLFDLAHIIGVAPWKISMSVYNGVVEPEIMQNIEDRGYQKNQWAVPRKSRNRKLSNMSQAYGKGQLLKIADEVLQSGTVHAASLAMIIVSMKMAVKENEFMPVRGANAIKTKSGEGITFMPANTADDSRDGGF